MAAKKTENDTIKETENAKSKKKKRGTPPLLVVEESQQRAPTLRETLSVLL